MKKETKIRLAVGLALLLILANFTIFQTQKPHPANVTEQIQELLSELYYEPLTNGPLRGDFYDRLAKAKSAAVGDQTAIAWVYRMEADAKIRDQFYERLKRNQNVDTFSKKLYHSKREAAEAVKKKSDHFSAATIRTWNEYATGRVATK